MSAFDEQKIAAEIAALPEEYPDVTGEDENVIQEKKGTQFDQRDMYRMGKTQELRRNFRFVSIFGFTMVLMATWEAQLT